MIGCEIVSISLSTQQFVIIVDIICYDWCMIKVMSTVDLGENNIVVITTYRVTIYFTYFVEHTLKKY
jgi:hypothetical protein